MVTQDHVTETGTIRKLGWAFRFAFYSNYGDILYRYRRNGGRYFNQSQELGLCYLATPATSIHFQN